MPLSIDPMFHECIATAGPYVGHEVISEIELRHIGQPCEHCGEVLATFEQLISHIYTQLTPRD